MAYVGNCTDCNRMWTWGDGKETICPTCAKIRQLTRERDELRAEVFSLRSRLAKLKNATVLLLDSIVAAISTGTYSGVVRELTVEMESIRAILEADNEAGDRED